MAKRATRKTTSLSISLSRELAQAIDRRVRSGLYTSASELIGDALRLLFEVEAAETRSTDRNTATKSERRLATAFDLAETGAAMGAEKRRRSGASFANQASRERLDSTVSAQDVGKGLRVAPERLKRLTLPR